ncbi:MAG: phosphatase PAP2 family protein [Deltaproteobacteria bacterium]|nr:phosphatase PAP2 family protein [Deltaproteobacteria bacterium]
MLRSATAFILLAACSARAAPPVPESEAQSEQSPFEVDLVLDLGITLGSLVVLGASRLFVGEFSGPACGLDCRPQDVNWLDRQVIGKRSAASDMASDIGAASAMALPFLLGAIDTLVSGPGDGWTGYAKDSLVLAETLSLTLGLNNTLNFIVRRPRPFAYDGAVDAERRLEAESAMSFPSGHTSASFAMATAYSYMYMRRHPDSPLVAPIWLGTHALACAVGVLRTEAGEHFYTDVLAGAALGVGLGLLVPWLHERRTASRISISPTAVPGGLALALTIR